MPSTPLTVSAPAAFDTRTSATRSASGGFTFRVSVVGRHHERFDVGHLQHGPRLPRQPGIQSRQQPGRRVKALREHLGGRGVGKHLECALFHHVVRNAIEERPSQVLGGQGVVHERRVGRQRLPRRVVHRARCGRPFASWKRCSAARVCAAGRAVDGARRETGPVERHLQREACRRRWRARPGAAWPRGRRGQERGGDEAGRRSRHGAGNGVVRSVSC